MPMALPAIFSRSTCVTRRLWGSDGDGTQLMRSACGTITCSASRHRSPCWITCSASGLRSPHLTSPFAQWPVVHPHLFCGLLLAAAKYQTNLPIFKLKESVIRRRYSDFEWLKNELERESKIVVPPLPGKAFKRQLPFRGDDGIFEETFIENRRLGLELFINKMAGQIEGKLHINVPQVSRRPALIGHLTHDVFYYYSI
uniref:Sorting nexin 12 n=1 Tax=Eptatretus burgeri TaxID=7764 RepID=A0A8C4QTQ2_EPTBU